jgi:hypothetical protein
MRICRTYFFSSVSRKAMIAAIKCAFAALLFLLQGVKEGGESSLVYGNVEILGSVRPTLALQQLVVSKLRQLDKRKFKIETRSSSYIIKYVLVPILRKVKVKLLN